MPDFNLIITGAGPAGLMAALTAAEKGARVLVLEKMNKAGKKLLITGNGRCNITNMASMSDFMKKINPQSRFLKPAFDNYFNKDIIALLHQNGVPTQVEEKGKVYPELGKAGDVLGVFMNRLHRLGVTLRYNCTVDELLINNGRITGVRYTEGDSPQQTSANAVIISTGGMSYPSTGATGDGYILAQQAGHTIIKPIPVLVPLITEGDDAPTLQGLSLKDVGVSVWVSGKKIKAGLGEILFTHYGLSGPLIHSLSRHAVEGLEADKETHLSIDMMPLHDDNATDALLLDAINSNGRKTFENLLKLFLPGKMIPFFLMRNKLSGSRLAHQISASERKTLRLFLKDLRFKIKGHRSFKEAIVTAGGVDTTEIDSRTMCSKLIPNLYFAGEILNVDGDTGGYNLQIAFSTGRLAGSCSAEGITR